MSPGKHAAFLEHWRGSATDPTPVNSREILLGLFFNFYMLLPINTCYDEGVKPKSVVNWLESYVEPVKIWKLFNSFFHGQDPRFGCISINRKFFSTFIYKNKLGNLFSLTHWTKSKVNLHIGNCTSFQPHTQTLEIVLYWLLSFLRVNIFEPWTRDHFLFTLIFAVTDLGPVCSPDWEVKSVKWWEWLSNSISDFLLSADILKLCFR